MNRFETDLWELDREGMNVDVAYMAEEFERLLQIRIISTPQVIGALLGKFKMMLRYLKNGDLDQGLKYARMLEEDEHGRIPTESSPSEPC